MGDVVPGPGLLVLVVNLGEKDASKKTITIWEMQSSLRNVHSCIEKRFKLDWFLRRFDFRRCIKKMSMDFPIIHEMVICKIGSAF